MRTGSYLWKTQRKRLKPGELEYNEYRPNSSLNDLAPREIKEHWLNEKRENEALLGAASSDPMIFGSVEKSPTEHNQI